MADLIDSDAALSPNARATLQALAGTVIPASAEYDVPGADDPAIFEDILASAGTALGFLDQCMRHLHALSGDAPFVERAPAARLELAEQFQAQDPEAAGLIVSLVCQCYYRDDRIMASLGMAPRPPFPEGYELDEGDWSLLDPVLKRGPIWRPVP
jgi:hypothetical protein